MKQKITVINTLIWNTVEVRIIYIEYSGGGTCYEYRISFQGEKIEESDNGYGQPESAASSAFQWLADNDIPT